MSDSISPSDLALLGEEHYSSERLPLGFRKIFYRDIRDTELKLIGKFWNSRLSGFELSGTSYHLPISNWGSDS